MTDNRNIHSPLLPGGNLIAAALDREVMGLADRGGASRLIGARWADVCAEWASGWAGGQSPVPDGGSAPLVVDRAIRLDHRPEIERAASRRALQNPDFLVLGRRDGRPALQAADAKFSVETARSKQVSSAVVEALLGLGDILRSAIGDVPARTAIVPGVFLCPDFPLTHLMLRRGRGIVRVTVTEREIILVPVSSRQFFGRIDGAPILPVLAAVDDLAVRIDDSLLTGLYYFRLARAAVGCWLDAVKPLLLANDQVEQDIAAVRAEADRRGRQARSAHGLILAWNADVETVRSQRAAVEQVAGLPLTGRELRELIGRMANGADEPPSVNQVRRRLGAWYRLQIRNQVGPLRPPVEDLPATLRAVAAAASAIFPQLERRAQVIVEHLIADKRTAAAASGRRT